MNLNTHTLLNMLSTKINHLTTTQVLKTKIEKLSVDGMINVDTLIKDKTIGTLINQLFKDIMSGVKTKGEVTQLLSNNTNSFSFKNISNDIKTIMNFLNITKASLPTTKEGVVQNDKLQKQITVLKESLLDLQNITNKSLKSNITNTGILLESKLLKNNTPITQDIKILLNQIKEHIEVKEKIIVNNKSSKQQSQANIQSQKNTPEQSIKINTPSSLQNIETSTNIKEEVKTEIKADVQKILKSIQNAQQVETKPLKQIILLLNIDNETKKLDNKLEKLNIKNDIATNLKEVISQVKEQIINKNIDNVKTTVLQLEDKINNLKAEPAKQEMISIIKEDIKSIKNNILNQPIQKDILTQLNSFESRINAPVFRALFENNKVNIANISNDLKSTILQIKEQIEFQALLGKEVITKELKATVEKVLSQIEFYQLVSYSSTSTSIPLSFLQDDIEDADIKFNKNNDDDNFSCQINLTLKKYGELKVLLVMDKKNNLNINIGIHNQELKNIVQSSLQKLRLGIGNINVALQSLNIFTLDIDNTKPNQKNSYTQNENLSFGLDIKA